MITFADKYKKKCLAFMADGKDHTAFEIGKAVGSFDVKRLIHILRADGCIIESRRISATVSTYQLTATGIFSG